MTGWNPFEEPDSPPSVTVDGIAYRAGQRVRLRPSRTSDILDLALAGKTAVIEAVEQDFDGRVYLAVVVEDDPGSDLGMQRLPGHRFFFSPAEIEPAEPAPEGDKHAA